MAVFYAYLFLWALTGSGAFASRNGCSPEEATKCLGLKKGRGRGRFLPRQCRNALRRTGPSCHWKKPLSPFSPIGGPFSKTRRVNVGQQHPHGQARQPPNLRGERSCRSSLPLVFPASGSGHETARPGPVSPKPVVGAVLIPRTHAHSAPAPGGTV